VVERDVVLAAFDALEQIGFVSDDEVGAYIQFVGQQLPKLDLEPRERVAVLELKGGVLASRAMRNSPRSLTSSISSA